MRDANDQLQHEVLSLKVVHDRDLEIVKRLQNQYSELHDTLSECQKREADAVQRKQDSVGSIILLYLDVWS